MTRPAVGRDRRRSCVILGVAAFRLVRRASSTASPSRRRARALHPPAPRRARPRVRLLVRRDLGDVDLGAAPSWSDARVRPRARHARLHRARDGRQPGGRGARAGEDPAAEPLRRHRARRARRRAAIGLVSVRRFPTSRRSSRAPLVAVVDALQGMLAGAGPSTPCGSSSGSARRSCSSRRSPRRSPAPAASRYSLGRHDMLPARLRPPEPEDPARAGGDRRARPACLGAPRRRGASPTATCASSGASTASASSSPSPPPRWPSCGSASPSRTCSGPFRAPWNVTVRGVLCRCRPLVGRRSPSLSGSSRSRRTRRRVSSGRSGSSLGVVVFVAVAPRRRRDGCSGASSPAEADLVPERGSRPRAHPCAAEARRRSARRCSRPRSSSPRSAAARSACCTCSRSRSTLPLDARSSRRGERGAEASLAEAQRVAHGARRRASTGTIVRARVARRGDRRRAPRERRRPHRHGLGAALAAPVALLQPDGGLRPAQGALRGDGDRLSRRASSRRTRRLQWRHEGDRRRLRPGRLGARRSARTRRAGRSPPSTRRRRRSTGSASTGPARSTLGHGMDTAVLEEAGIADADMRHRRDRRRQHEPGRRPGREAPLRRPERSPSGSSTQRGPSSTRTAGFDVVSPTMTAIEALAAWRSRADGLMFVIVVGGGKVGSNVTRTLLGLGHEVVVLEQRQAPLRAPRRRVRAPRPPRRRHRALRARGGGHPAAAGHRRRGHRRRRGQPHHLPARQGALRGRRRSSRG